MLTGCCTTRGARPPAQSSSGTDTGFAPTRLDEVLRMQQDTSVTENIFPFSGIGKEY